MDYYIWHSQVQDQEIDIQEIVNNAVYLQYFDRARVACLMAKGIDWEAWHHNGLDIVLIHVDMEFKHPLRANDKFYVRSNYQKVGRLRVVFDQAIYNSANNKLIAKAKNTLVCVTVRNRKPVMPEELEKKMFY